MMLYVQFEGGPLHNKFVGGLKKMKVRQRLGEPPLDHESMPVLLAEVGWYNDGESGCYEFVHSEDLPAEKVAKAYDIGCHIYTWRPDEATALAYAKAEVKAAMGRT